METLGYLAFVLAASLVVFFFLCILLWLLRKFGIGTSTRWKWILHLWIIVLSFPLGISLMTVLGLALWGKSGGSQAEIDLLGLLSALSIFALHVVKIRLPIILAVGLGIWALVRFVGPASSQDGRRTLRLRNTLAAIVLALICYNSFQHFIAKQNKETADSKDASPEDLMEVFKKNPDDRFIQEAIAKNPSTPPELLEKIAREKGPSLRASVAQNPSVSPELLEKLAIDSNSLVRFMAIRTLKLGQATFAILSQDEDWEIRSAAVSSLQSDLVLLELLARDPDRQVRKAVEKRRDLPKGIQELLMMSNLSDLPAWYKEAEPFNNFRSAVLKLDSTVRERIARGSLVADELLKTLASSDPDGFLKKASEGKLEDIAVGVELGKNLNLTVDQLLDAIAKSSSRKFDPSNRLCGVSALVFNAIAALKEISTEEFAKIILSSGPSCRIDTVVVVVKKTPDLKSSDLSAIITQVPNKTVAELIIRAAIVSVKELDQTKLIELAAILPERSKALMAYGTIARIRPQECDPMMPCKPKF